MDWRFEPSEAIDAIVFCNAVSQDDFYARCYPGLRASWAPALGESGLRAIDQCRAPSMSCLSYLLDAVGVRTLEDVVGVLAGLPGSAERIEAAVGAEPAAREGTWWREGLATLRRGGPAAAEPWRYLRQAGFAEHWRRDVLPGLARAADRLAALMAPYPLSSVAAALGAFLGAPRVPAGSRVALVRYIAPIAFTLPHGAMALQPDHAPSCERMVCLCVHESLHGFPDSAAALAAQRRWTLAHPEFAAAYEAWRRQAQTGDEEHLVAAAEAYLSECLGVRSHQDCVDYLRRQNGGMPLAACVYARLRAERPDRAAGWRGYGPWAAELLAHGGVRPDWPDG